MSDLRLVIFDVDGTLVDSQHHIAASMARAFASQGLPAPGLAETRGIIGLSLPRAMRVLAPEADHAALVEAYKAGFADLRQRAAAPSPLYPGAQEALDDLQSRDEVLLGVATGKSQRGLDALIAAHGLEGLFVTRQVADHHPSKPHPSMIEACLRETGVDPHCAIMVGDTSFDMEMARAAGIGAIGVRWGYHSGAQLGAAHHLIGDFSDLPEALEQLWKVMS